MISNLDFYNTGYEQGLTHAFNLLKKIFESKNDYANPILFQFGDKLKELKNLCEKEKRI